MSKSIIFTPDAPAPIGPYSQATEANGTVYVSGQVAIDPATSKLIEGGVAEQTEQVMKNLEAVLKAAGLTFANVVKCSIFVKSMDDFGTVNGIYGKAFPENPPARETVEVARLPLDVLVEISCIAVA